MSRAKTKNVGLGALEGLGAPADKKKVPGFSGPGYLLARISSARRYDKKVGESDTHSSGPLHFLPSRLVAK